VSATDVLPTGETVEQTVDEKISEAKFKDANRWGPMGLLAFAVLIIAGAFAYTLVVKGPPAVAVGPAQSFDVWTNNDQVRFEAGNATRMDKMDRMIERLDSLIVSQAKMVDRLLSLVERQDERIRSLEDWRSGSRK